MACNPHNTGPAHRPRKALADSHFGKPSLAERLYLHPLEPRAGEVWTERPFRPKSYSIRSWVPISATAAGTDGLLVLGMFFPIQPCSGGNMLPLGLPCLGLPLTSDLSAL